MKELRFLLGVLAAISFSIFLSYHFGYRDREVVSRSMLFVPANKMITESSVIIKKDQILVINAGGAVNSSKNCYDSAFRWVGPEGSNWSWGKRKRRVNSSFMSLIAKIGDQDWFKIGRGFRKRFSEGGQLFFAVNDDLYDRSGRFRPDWIDDNQGRFVVEVVVKK